jgi:AAA+ superfamily predicted ATPase
MESKSTKNAVEIICMVSEQAENCKLDDKELEKLQPYLKILGDMLNITSQQAFWISIMYMYSFKSTKFDYSDLANYLECNILKIVSYQNDFNELVDRRIISKNDQNRQGNPISNNFSIPFKTFEKINNNKPFETQITKVPIIEKTVNEIDFLEQIFLNFEKVENENIHPFEALDEANEIINRFNHLKLVNKIMGLNLKMHDLSMYLLICWDGILGNESTSLNEFLKKVYGYRSSYAREVQDFVKKTNALIKQNLIIIKPDRFMNNLDISLSEKSILMLEDEGIKMFDLSTIESKNLMKCNDIFRKKLLFNESEQKQYTLIESSIKNVAFKKIQANLSNKGLPKGITVLLHGEPGTGKTETVLQMAKASKRDVFKVDISNTKSPWFGESQSKIKKVFSSYKRVKEKAKVCPILFINEADGLFSKRKDSNSSSVAQTENEIQNILLEELENFDGILFATTNIINNFDIAFDRRFLFKFHLPKPDLQLRVNLWKSKIKKLKFNQYETLAKNFDFSGGEIDNIVRKIEIFEILNQDRLTFENIVQYCEDDLMRKQNIGNKIGY